MDDFVDDEEMMLEVGQAFLEKLGYRVIVAVGGKQAVETLYSEGDTIDMVILDLIMPGMDGSRTFDMIVKFTRFDIGQTSNEELLRAQDLLAMTSRSHARAIADYNTTIQELTRAQGILPDGVTIEEAVR